MKNKQTDLHNILVEQLEYLNDRDIKGAELDEEIRRANASCNVAAQIIANGNLAYNVAKFVESAGGKIKLPPMLTE